MAPRVTRSVPEEASHNVLQQSRSLLLHQLAHHVGKDGAHCVEPLVSSADIVQAVVIQQDLLDNEYCNCLAELGACLHDAQAERNDLGGQQKVDDFRRVILDKSPNDA